MEDIKLICMDNQKEIEERKQKMIEEYIDFSIKPKRINFGSKIIEFYSVKDIYRHSGPNLIITKTNGKYEILSLGIH